MTTLRTTFIATAAALFAVAGFAGTASATDASCELRITDRGSMLEIEPMVTSATAINGAFDLAINGGGTEIAQSGGFTTQPGVATSLGVMNLSLGAKYNAKLKISWAGGSARCTQVLG